MRSTETFDLKSLSAATGVAPRTVHFYVQQGLLPPPIGAGRAARYTAVHRDRLILIRRLQDQHQPLAEIRKHLDRIPDAMLGQVASTPSPRPKSAVDYIRSVLGAEPLRPTLPLLDSARPRPTIGAPRSPSVLMRAVDGPESAPASGLDAAPPPDRSQWERLSLHPDIELHVRRPGSRATNRKVEKLVEFARTIFREDA
jgi:hypothetical protein